MSDLVGTVPQVARRLECSEWKVRELIRAGRLPFIRLGDQKIVVPWKALEEWLASEVAANTGTGEVPRPPATEDNGAATYTVTEAAKILGMSRATLYRAIDRGELTAIRFGRAVQIPRHVVDRLLERT